MNKESKQEYINEMKNQFDKSEAVIVAHYQGLTVSQLDELRNKMREHGIQFKITKKRLVKGMEQINRKDLISIYNKLIPGLF